MLSQFPRILIVPVLAGVCSAQQVKQTEADQRKTAERIAATLDLQQFHADAAKGFAALGPVALPVLERVLEKGTDVEALGALTSVVAISGDSDRILGLLEGVVARRAKVLEIGLVQQRRGRRGRGARPPSPGGAALVGYLHKQIETKPKAVDLLWSLVGGPMQAAAVFRLSQARTYKTRLLGHVARGLDSRDKPTKGRAIAYLTWMPRYGQEAPPDVVTAIEELLASQKPDLTSLKKLSKSRDGITKAAARGFLSMYRDLQRARRANEVARKKLQIAKPAGPKPAGLKPTDRFVSMLDLPTLRDRAITELARIGVPAVPMLEKALGHENRLVAAGAVQALAGIQPPDAKVVDLLTKVLVDKNRPAAARITSMVYLSKQMETNGALFEAIRDRTAESEPIEVRIAAIRQLARTEKHHHDAINTLEVVLRSKQIEVVEYATAALGMMAARIKDDRILMLLLRQLQNPDNKIKQAAIYALSGKGAKVHLQRLRKREDLDPSIKKLLDRALATKPRVLAGFLIADYSDNRIVQIGLDGEELHAINKIFGVWDVEVLSNGNYLITEFSVNRISEITPDGKRVWGFEDLKNPYDADRLPNGNTLIADTFGRRVIEVDKAGRIVWKYDKDIHPYDVDRLPNGNTLIADTHDDRVIEVDAAGRIVWQVRNVPNVHDADRLPNGNTLLTIRMLNEVREIDSAGRTVFSIKNLSSPSDADRLPDGRTLVAENGYVRIFDARGVEVWRKAITWAVEVNPVWKYQREAQKKAGGK